MVIRYDLRLRSSPWRLSYWSDRCHLSLIWASYVIIGIIVLERALALANAQQKSIPEWHPIPLLADLVLVCGLAFESNWRPKQKTKSYCLEHDWIEPLTYQSLALVAQRCITELMWRIDVVAKKVNSGEAARKRTNEKSKRPFRFFIWKAKKSFCAGKTHRRPEHSECISTTKIDTQVIETDPTSSNLDLFTDHIRMLLYETTPLIFCHPISDPMVGEVSIWLYLYTDCESSFASLRANWGACISNNLISFLPHSNYQL